MICLGIAIMFYMRAYFFKARPKPEESDAASAVAVRSMAA
jgi:hypothetical protein